MRTTNEFNEYNQQNSFKKIFDFKGEIAPIAEKAHRNLEIKTKNETNRVQRVHYFAIGHTFKQLDKEALFKYELDYETERKHPTAFLSLLAFDQPFCDELKELVSNLRNLNSHYIHNFEKIKTYKLSERMKTFIAESFELAVLQTCFNETVALAKTPLTFDEFSQQSDLHRKLVQFLCDKFYPVGTKDSYPDDYMEYRAMFRTMKKVDAIDALLFAEVGSDYDWKLFGEHPVFTITAGRYLSFYGCLFMLSMFLYRSEANQLISKIKGFKRNGTKEEQSKRDIFTFFAKKFSSQDIDSEENHLVKFRDLIQYLSKYPVAWNKEMELEPEHPALTNRLKMEIIDMEIDRSFPEYAGNLRFRVFAKYTIWGKRFLGKAIEKEYIAQSFSSKEMDGFSYAINTSPQLKGENLKLANLESRTGTYSNNRREKDTQNEIYKTKKSIEKIENEPNRVLEKLKKRIETNMLYVSYGRNHDRFMEFAARYLAEIHYFGHNAQFKMYRFLTTAEQNEEMEMLKDSLSKKEFDKLKFHQGKRTEYSTWTAHHERYPEWDLPFVVENNAIQVKLGLVDGGKKIISIQRDLLAYLLEHVLYYDCTKGTGQRLLAEYYLHHSRAFNGLKTNLEKNEPIATEQRGEYKKLLPRRLVNHYCPPTESPVQEESPLQRLLSKAIRSEERYAKLVEQARQENRYDDFVKHNKGKQFKLQFVRKAWNLMYFREIYNQQATASGHHKRFNITRDEFNDFSRYLFAFDEVPAYKDFLRGMLNKKGFFENQAFKTLFDQGRSLDELYHKTKQAYQRWMESEPEREANTEKYTLAGYTNLFADAMFYINLSHFIAFLRSKGMFGGEQGPMQFDSLLNVPYLIANYYMAERFDKAIHQNAKKLFNQLQAAKHEDTLLYEIAMRYLQHEPQIEQTTKANVREIMNNTVAFSITDANWRFLYTLTVPFKQLESFETLVMHKKEQEEKYKSSFLVNLPGYLEKVKAEKDVKEIYVRIRNKELSFDDLGKINNHLISASIKFTRLALTLEHYFVFKKRQLIVNDNRITIDEIPELRTYFSKQERNKAFHFSVPDRSYREMTAKIESAFAIKEVTPEHATGFDALLKPTKYVCKQMLTANHNEFFGREKDGKKKQRDAEARFFEQVIKGNQQR